MERLKVGEGTIRSIVGDSLDVVAEEVSIGEKTGRAESCDLPCLRDKEGEMGETGVDFRLPARRCRCKPLRRSVMIRYCDHRSIHTHKHVRSRKCVLQVMVRMDATVIAMLLSLDLL